MMDFDPIKNYGPFIERDPFRNDLHYPSVVGELGSNIKGRILDVGCGEGRLARKMYDLGAEVVGYDIAPSKIAEAEEKEQEGKRRIVYTVATPTTFSAEKKFDAAVSVMVLPYAKSLKELNDFFRHAFGKIFLRIN